ncbi:MAG: hypothetical protein HC817_11705 [Saprospiraceae bacterium]|nr:hypothetical protein [Saprospiraceae bacterium]
MYHFMILDLRFWIYDFGFTIYDLRFWIYDFALNWEILDPKILRGYLEKRSKDKFHLPIHFKLPPQYFRFFANT